MKTAILVSLAFIYTINDSVTMYELGELHTINPSGVHSASVIFLHGSKGTGKGLLDLLRNLSISLDYPHIKFLFPTAPTMPYSFIGGKPSTIWFDRYDRSPDVPENDESIEMIKDKLKELVENEIKSGIPLNRTIIGGFSMGGAISLHMSYRFLAGFRGIFALSAFLNNKAKVYENIQSTDTPLFMCHGDSDDLVPLKWGKDTFDRLVGLGVKGEFTQLHGVKHELGKEEINSLLKWVINLLPEEHVENHKFDI